MDHELSRRVLVSKPLNTTISSENVFDPQACIYMSPDGEEVLETLDPQKVYIIGGIVDRTVTKVCSFSLLR